MLLPEEVEDCVVSDAEMGEPMLHVGVEALIRVVGFNVLKIEIVCVSLYARWKGVVLLQLVLTGQRRLRADMAMEARKRGVVTELSKGTSGILDLEQKQSHGDSIPQS